MKGVLAFKSAVKGLAIVLNFFMNFLSNEVNPKKLWISLMDLGCGQFFMVSIFLGSTLTPLEQIRNPKS